MKETTVVLVKPDGVQKKVIGKIITMLEDAGLTIDELGMVQLDEEILRTWYAHHADKPFFPDLLSYMQETPVAAIIVSGEGAVQKVFDICGPTDPAEAPDGTIRKLFGESKSRNVVHRSDSVEAAEREIELLFGGHGHDHGEHECACGRHC